MVNNSPSSLFHFTDSAEKLIGILKSEFRPSFCLERIRFGGEVIEVAIPMVCFCDIPLSQVKKHIETYGCYGLGLSKDWAEQNGLNPILYLKENSLLSENLKVIKEHISTFPDLDTVSVNLEDLAGRLAAFYAYQDFLRYVKNYEGPILREGSSKNVRFYDEKEWRYVPKIDFLGIVESVTEKKDPIPYILRKEDYENPIRRANANSEIANQRLNFEPTDIKYVIVKEEKEIHETIKALRKIKSKYDLATVDILTSRIITSEQIINDF